MLSLVASNLLAILFASTCVRRGGLPAWLATAGLWLLLLAPLLLLLRAMTAG